jgi:hypothetical protein
MPNMQLPTKKWGKVDKAALAKLVHNRDVDINDLSYNNINAVRKEHFCHPNKKNFVATSVTLQPHLSSRLNMVEQGGEEVRWCIFHCFIHLVI